MKPLGCTCHNVAGICTACVDHYQRQRERAPSPVFEPVPSHRRPVKPSTLTTMVGVCAGLCLAGGVGAINADHPLIGAGGLIVGGLFGMLAAWRSSDIRSRIG